MSDNLGREGAQEAAINAMDYDATGTLLVTSSDDETLRLYSTETATSRKVLFSKKYGIDLVRFTHSQEAVICASKNNWDGLPPLHEHQHTTQLVPCTVIITHMCTQQRRSGTCRCTTTRTCATSGATGTACSRCACRRRRTRS